jgi:F-type H+-transporting ATPase subunit epsilon
MKSKNQKRQKGKLQMPNNSENETSSAAAGDAPLMNLQVLLPFKVFARYESVQSIVLETPQGAFGLLPHRQDCVAALEPGILTYTINGQASHYLAIDEGVMVKNGQQVSVSVRNAHSGTDLAALRQSVQTEFLSLTEQELEVRAVLARLESGFMRGFKSLKSR